MDALSEKLAALIREAQGQLGINQRQLASRASISESQLSGLVRGHKPLRRETYLKLQRVFPATLHDALHALYEVASQSADEVLLHARDVATIQLPITGPEQYAHLIGLITQRYKNNMRLDWTLTDETGSAPIVIDRLISPTTYERAKPILKESRVEVHGIVGSNARGVTSVIADAVKTYGSSRTPDNSELDIISPAIYTARLISHFRSRFTADQYTEISARIISSDWPPGGLYPLKALYDGFGQPFYIAPSPLPQLVRTLIHSRYENLFAVSRCFTQTYRDPTASVEAVILCAVTTQGNIERELLNCHEMVTRLYSSASTAPQRDLPTSAVVVRQEWPIPRMASAVKSPEIQLFGIDFEHGRRQVGRLCWPQLKAPGEDFHEYVIAEGYSSSDDVKGFTAFTINIERLLALLIAEVDIRRIPALAYGAN